MSGTDLAYGATSRPSISRSRATRSGTPYAMSAYRATEPGMDLYDVEAFMKKYGDIQGWARGVALEERAGVQVRFCDCTVMLICYDMSGTDSVSVPSVRRLCYAVSGTGISYLRSYALAMPCSVLTYAMMLPGSRVKAARRP
eukprot:410173-Rhodomonas_salina.4